MKRRSTLLAAFLLALTLFPPAPVSAHNFTESNGCGVAGLRGPLSDRGGWLPLSEEVDGPWADFFGRNGYALEDRMVTWRPYRSSRTVRVHELALPAFELVNQNLAAEYARGNYYPVTSAWGWAYRAVTGESNRTSFHAFGTAVDINPAQNPYNNDDPPVLVTDMPPWYVKAWTDAGFCWGGDWVSIKDAMHFSWMGPAATPGYPATPAPASRITAPAGYRSVGFNGPLGFSDGGWQYDVMDRSRDGAPDVYAWRWTAPGEIRVEVASAFGDFRDIGIRETVSVGGGPDTHGVTFADHDNDGQADLWVVDWGTDQLTIYGDTVGEADRFTQVIGQFTLGVSDGVVIRGADYNRDRAVDAYVINAAGELTILGGSSGFQNVLVDVATGARPQWNRFDVADYDANGAPDLYAVSAVGSQVYVANGFGSGFFTGPYWSTAVPKAGQAQIADYDGDGRGDVYHFENGILTIYLGGERAPGTDLKAWFEDPIGSPWDAGPECVGPGRCDKVGFVTDGLEYNLRDNLSWEGGDYHEFFFGVPGDVAVMGDWNGDGVSTPGMFRPSNGFVYLSNKNATQVAPIEFFFGIEGDVPLAGDWNGNGRDSLSIYRPSDGRLYVSNKLQTQFAEFSYAFALPGSVPFAGDFNGDGKHDLGLYRASDGLVAMRFTGSGSTTPDRQFYVGSNAETVVAGDWSGEGIDTLAWHNDAEGRWYFRLDNAQGPAEHVLRAGPRDASITPISGTWAILG